MSAGRAAFEPLGGETLYEGRIVRVCRERFRHGDGEVVEREVVHQAGAVAVLAYDERELWLVRQPRETVGEPELLELPAGRLDVPGESPLAAARRELAEEIGLGAHEWEPVLSYYASAGVSDERVHLFAARRLYRSSADSGEEERIEAAPWPLGELEQAIAACEDAKTLIGLQWLALRLRA